MRDLRANRERALALLAARQHGVVSAAQLRAAGIGKHAVSRRLRAGRLHRLHRGVYAVGHTKLSFEGRCMAAVLALDGAAVPSQPSPSAAAREGSPLAVVSHRSAAGLWDLLPPSAGAIDVTVPGDAGRRRRAGIKVHRSFTLNARVSSRRRGIALTSPARTLRDLRRTLPQQTYRRALRRALDLRLIRSSGLSEADLTRSQLERSFLQLCRRHHLPQPAVNARVGPYEVDFVWPDRRLIVETDGFRHHGDRASFEADRARDAELQAHGYTVLRFTYRQVRNRTDVAKALRALLGPVSLPGMGR